VPQYVHRGITVTSHNFDDSDSAKCAPVVHRSMIIVLEHNFDDSDGDCVPQHVSS
jgi:hypothetical protein